MDEEKIPNTLKKQRVVARWGRYEKPLVSLVEDPMVPTEVKRVAVRNLHLSTTALSYITTIRQELDKEVILSLLRHPALSRDDIVTIARTPDKAVTIAALSAPGALSGNISVCHEFIYNEDVDISRTAMNAAMRQTYKEEATILCDLYDRLDEKQNDLKEVALRSIANPLVLEMLVMVGNETIQKLISKNPNLAPCTIDRLLDSDHINIDIARNLAQYNKLNTEQIGRLLEIAISENDFEICKHLAMNPNLNSEQLELLINDRHDLYNRLIEDRFAFLPTETKEQILIDMEETFMQSLAQNTGIARDMIEQQYQITIPPYQVAIPDLDDLQLRIGIEMESEERNLVDLFDTLTNTPMDDNYTLALLELADRKDMDPDIQRTVMLALMNSQGNTLQSMNELSNKLNDDKNKLVSVVGRSGCAYRREAPFYISSKNAIEEFRTYVGEKYRSTKYAVSKKIATLESIMYEKLTHLKEELPTAKMTDMNLSKETIKKIGTDTIKKIEDSVKSINPFERKQDNIKRGRRR